MTGFAFGVSRLTAVAALLATGAPASAQISIQLGGSDADMKAMLAAQGYDLAALRAFDAFPMTHHMECVALFRRA